ncbi:MMPL family transporter [Deltaproteobacteria bacterium TL4]
MQKLKYKIEALLVRYSHWIYDKAWRGMVVLLLLTGVLISQLPSITMLFSYDSFFPKKSSVIQQFEDFRRQFGRDEILMVGIQSPEIFSQSFLKRLKSLHNELAAKVPYVEEVTSLVNVTSIQGEDGGLKVTKLMDDWPETEQELEAFKQQVLKHPGYRNALISEDASMVAIVLRPYAYSPAKEEAKNEPELEGEDNFENTESLAHQNSEDEEGEDVEDEDSEESDDFGEPLSKPSSKPPASKIFDFLKKEELKQLSNQENAEFIEAIRKIVATYQGPDFQVFIAGSPALTYWFLRSVAHDTPLFILVTIGSIALCQLLIFRRVSGFLLPLLIVILSLGATLGLMALFGVPVTPLSQALPSILLAIGIGDSVHFLTGFYHHLELTGDKRESIAYSLSRNGIAMVMTSLTTAGGLLSFMNASIPPIVELGLFGAIGVMISLFFTFTLLPFIMIVVPLKSKQSHFVPKVVEQVLKSLGELAITHPWKAIIGAMVAGILGALSMTQLEFRHNTLEWFPEHSEIRVGTKAIDKHMKGAVSIEILVDTQKENGLYEPKIMNGLEAINQFAEAFHEKGLFIGKASSIVNILKEIHQGLNDNRPEFYVVPQDRQLITQELFLFQNSGSSELEKKVDTLFSKARVTLRLPRLEAKEYSLILDVFDKEFHKVFGEDVKITITGAAVLLEQNFNNVIYSMVRSYLAAGIVITLLMLLLIGRIRLGFLSILPNFLPIIVGLGMISLLGMSIDLSSIMIGSIVMGLVVDNTIHFMHNYQRYFYETQDAAQAIRLTLQTSGRAMFFTTVIMAVGFFILMLSEMGYIFDFGFMAGFTVLFALIVDLLVTPALMVLAARYSWLLSR